ncbi:hypothetical protein BDQ17DRAFT_1376964 [Cyathus striatus]|nr:hypothetical protein BDQ17DRAFT_1376964 [Cyathus striatus]
MGGGAGTQPLPAISLLDALDTGISKSRCTLFLFTCVSVSSAEPLPMPYKAPPCTNSGDYALVHLQAQDSNYELQDSSHPQSD